MLAAVYNGGIDMEYDCMVSQIRRKTSLTLDAEALDCARELGVNVSAVAEAALVKAVA
ncbi:type II toxin-antitoxin system CcdA family antitoxin, partial [Phaeobacter sp. 22II1-1F12B]|uniref:type II toxin-antitoxin system CcdA family antitoxin n=1 Tax=Phaeobacter sp. 22II1-1F12B TaxID=1317111 RepID=UPI0035172DAE